MLVMPRNSTSHVNIIGIDPGTTMLGVSVYSIDIATLKILSSKAWTFNGAKLSGNHGWVTELHGDRASRIHYLEEALLETFNYYQPVAIASEAPFINKRFPQAGLALTEVVSAIRRAVMRYDYWKCPYFVDPPTAKKAVGAPGYADKDVVKKHVAILPDLNYVGEVPIQFLDEHSIDALAIGYHQVLTIRNSS